MIIVSQHLQLTIVLCLDDSGSQPGDSRHTAVQPPCSHRGARAVLKHSTDTAEAQLKSACWFSRRQVLCAKTSSQQRGAMLSACPGCRVRVAGLPPLPSQSQSLKCLLHCPSC